MKVEIRNVKHHPDLSEETECFSADLHIDGKRIGSVSNRGTGGGDDCHGDHAAYDAADRWLLYTIRVRAPHKPIDPAVQARLIATYPGATILNALPIEEAWTIYSECSE